MKTKKSILQTPRIRYRHCESRLTRQGNVWPSQNSSSFPRHLNLSNKWFALDKLHKARHPLTTRTIDRRKKHRCNNWKRLMLQMFRAKTALFSWISGKQHRSKQAISSTSEFRQGLLQKICRESAVIVSRPVILNIYKCVHLDTLSKKEGYF